MENIDLKKTKKSVIDEPMTAGLKQICKDFSEWSKKQGNGEDYSMSDYQINKAIIAKKEKALRQKVEENSAKSEEELNTSKQKSEKSTSQNLVLSTQEGQNKEESLSLAKQGQTTLSNVTSELAEKKVLSFSSNGAKEKMVSSFKRSSEVPFYFTPGKMQLHAKEKSQGFTNLTIQPTGQIFSEDAKKPVITVDTWTKIIFLFQVLTLSKKPVALATRVAVVCGKEVCSKLVGLVSNLKGGATLPGKDYANPNVPFTDLSESDKERRKAYYEKVKTYYAKQGCWAMITFLVAIFVLFLLYGFGIISV